MAYKQTLLDPNLACRINNKERPIWFMKKITEKSYPIFQRLRNKQKTSLGLSGNMKNSSLKKTGKHAE